ncbi:MAG: hypothetical protein IPI30_21640 [Saprospiraceae bacterium]|nr:hypothetical protein [Candidatus Vicinibacter affinis]
MEALATGNCKQVFRYRWIPGGQNSPNIRVCDTVPIRYTVIATDSASGVMDTADFLDTPMDVPKILKPRPDRVCASAADWRYQVDIPEGDFFPAPYPTNNVKRGCTNSGDMRRKQSQHGYGDLRRLMVARFQILCTFIQSMPVQTSSFVLAHLLYRSVGAVRPGVIGPGPESNPTAVLTLQQWVNLILFIQHPTVVKIPARFCQSQSKDPQSSA